MTDEQFPKQLRLLDEADFERVFSVRASASDSILVVYGAANSLEHPRLGLTVSRKVGNSVARNRWKRLIREAFRRARHELPKLDLICLPRATAEPELEPLRQSLQTLAARIERRLARSNNRSSS